MGPFRDFLLQYIHVGLPPTLARKSSHFHFPVFLQMVEKLQDPKTPSLVWGFLPCQSIQIKDFPVFVLLFFYITVFRKCFNKSVLLLF